MRVKVSAALKRKILDICDKNANYAPKQFLDDVKNGEVDATALLKFIEISSQTSESSEPLITSRRDVALSLKDPVVKNENSELTEKQIKEKEERRKYLQQRQEEREYNMMMYGKTENPNTAAILGSGSQFDSLKSHLSIGFNLIISIFATCGIAYYLSLQLGFTQPHSLMIGLVAAIIMMLVEMTLFIIRALEIDEPRRNKQKDAFREAKIRSGALLTPADMK